MRTPLRWAALTALVALLTSSPFALTALAQREQVEDTKVADEDDSRPLFERQGKKTPAFETDSPEVTGKKNKAVRQPAKNRYAVADPALELADPRTYRLRVVVKITAQEAEVDNLVATCPIPMEWPEQKVRLLEEKREPSTARVSEQVLPGQAAILKFQVPHIAKGKEASVERLYEITRYRTKFTLPPEDLVMPKTCTAGTARAAHRHSAGRRDPEHQDDRSGQYADQRQTAKRAPGPRPSRFGAGRATT